MSQTLTTETCARMLISELQGLVEAEDRGALAALRRGLGKRPGEAAEMFPYVVPYLPEDRWAQDWFFVVASLFAVHPLSWQAEGNTRDTNFGASFRRLREAKGQEEGDSLENRFVALLDSRGEDLPHHLRRAIGLMKGEEIPVNWYRLLIDLTYWDHPDRFVQRQWAEQFWRRQPAEQSSDQLPTTT
mgnify:CR=1 FL=1